MLTKHPLLAKTVILAETASFGRKTCFGRITERGESRKAETETCFGRNFRPKPNRNSIRLTTKPEDGLEMLVLLHALEPLHGRHSLPVTGDARLRGLGGVHEAEDGGAGNVLGDHP